MMNVKKKKKECGKNVLNLGQYKSFIPQVLFQKAFCELHPLRGFTLLALLFSLEVASTSLIHSCFIVSLFQFLHDIFNRYFWKGGKTHNIMFNYIASDYFNLLKKLLLNPLHTR